MVAKNVFYHGGPANPDKKRPKYVMVATFTQTLYSDKTLAEVERNGKEVSGFLNNKMPFEVRYFGNVKSEEDARKLVAATQDEDCVGLGAWYHTFHPGEISQHPLEGLNVPFIHMLTSYDKSIPWKTINMDYMNCNQCAHGGPEGGNTAVNVGRTQHIAAGHWKSNVFLEEFEILGRAAATVMSLKGQKVLRIGGGRMPGVFGTDCSSKMLNEYCGMGLYDEHGPYDLHEVMKSISDKKVEAEVDRLSEMYKISSQLGRKGDWNKDLLYAGRITAAVREMLKDGDGYPAWTYHFGNLGPIKQLAGLAAQVLMSEGYGFGAENDAFSSVMTAAELSMGQDLKGGSTFTEPYVFDWDLDAILYAHMLEMNPDLAAGKPTLEFAPLSIGGKDDPPRLVFRLPQDKDCILTSMYESRELGYQLLSVLGKTMKTPDTPNLRLASGLIKAYAGARVASKCAVKAGASHHPDLSTALTIDHVDALADMWGMVHHVIDANTNYRQFKRELDLLKGTFRR